MNPACRVEWPGYRICEGYSSCDPLILLVCFLVIIAQKLMMYSGKQSLNREQLRGGSAYSAMFF